MAQILEKTKKSIIVEFTSKEFKELTKNSFDENDINSYDIVFDEPMDPKELLKTLKKYG
jgi:hypothetical protein